MDKEVMDKLTLILSQAKVTGNVDPQRFFEFISYLHRLENPKQKKPPS
jgi:hypothetical protein